jgi:hypothetical protein
LNKAAAVDVSGYRGGVERCHPVHGPAVPFFPPQRFHAAALGQSGERRKQFFFEKKNQKTFNHSD